MLLPTLAWTLIPLVAILAVPWVLGLLGMGIQGWLQQRWLRAGRSLSRPARQWLESRATRSGLSTNVEVHATLAEAYFPQTDTVGLSPTAAASAHPVHRAMVAHELGHAATAHLHPLLRTALPAARLAIDGLPFAVSAAILVGALHQSPWLLACGGALLCLTVLAQAVVVADEATASYRAWRWLQADTELTDADVRACTRSLVAALSAYAAPAVGWLALTLAWPLISAFALSGATLPAAEPLDSTGTWLLLFLGPALCLHAGLVVAETCRPEPVQSAFQLGLRQERQHSWGFTAGICALIIAVGVSGWGDGLLFEAALALAVFTGLEPASVLLRALLLLPVYFIAKAAGLGPWMERVFEPPSQNDEALPAAITALWEAPPWFLRGARLLQLSWVPLVAFVLVQAYLKGGSSY
ncbi:MAG: zinc metallopeptidase [Myxococcota bacterium]